VARGVRELGWSLPIVVAASTEAERAHAERALASTGAVVAGQGQLAAALAGLTAPAGAGPSSSAGGGNSSMFRPDDAARSAPPAEL
jgi:hypothetical protein